MDAREIVSTLASSSQLSSPVQRAEEGTSGGRRESPLLSKTGEGVGDEGHGVNMISRASIDFLGT